MTYSSKFTKSVLEKKNKESYVEQVLNGTYKAPTLSATSNISNNSVKNITIDELKSQKEKLLTERNKIKREKTVDITDNDGFFNNAWEVISNLFNPKYKKYKPNEEYEKLSEKIKNINAQIENYEIENKEYSKGFMGAVEKANETFAGNMMTSTKGIESTIQKLLGRTPTNTEQHFYEKQATKARQETSGVGGTALDVFGSVVRMIPQIAVGNPTGAMAMGFANYGGGAYNQAKQEGATETQATMYGVTIGGLEMLLNKILPSFKVGDSNIYGKTLTDNIMKKVLVNTTFKQIISGSAGEFAEEYLQQFLEPIVKNVILEQENGADFWNTMKDDFGKGLKQLVSQFVNAENFKAGLLGGLTSFGLGGLGGAVSAVNQTQNQNTQAIESQTTPTLPRTQNNITTQENSKLPGINNIKNSLIQNTTQVNPLRESANRYFGENIDADLINNLETIQNKRSTDKSKLTIEFDDTVATNGVNISDGTNRVIKINPNSPNALETVLVHELAHDFENTQEFDKLKEFVLEQAKLKGDFEESRAHIKKVYEDFYKKKNLNLNELDIDTEVVNDILARQLGNQEYISKLAIEQPNVFKKMYDWIKNVLLDGNNTDLSFSERSQLNKLQNMFEEVYRTTYNENNQVSQFYSINPNFVSEFESWDKIDRSGSFVLGNTSSALKQTGLEKRDIVIDKTKLIKILNDHPEMTEDIIKQIPLILENPTLILNSESKKGRMVIFGEVYDQKNNPVLVAMELNPIENKNNVEKIYKVASAYGKENLNSIQRWLNKKENIVYVDAKKNRTINWLNGLGLQLPVPLDQLGSYADNIPQSNTNVKSDTSSTKYSMQESQNNTQYKKIKTADAILNDMIIDDYKNANGISTSTKELTKRLSEFKSENKSDFDDANDSNISSNYYLIDDNLVKLTTTLENRTIYIDELYVEKQKQGTGTKVVNELKKYAKENGYELTTSDELSTAKVFWDKVLRNKNQNYSQNDSQWQGFLEDNYKSTGTKTNMQEIKLPRPKKVNLPKPQQTEIVDMEQINKKVLNPNEKNQNVAQLLDKRPARAKKTLNDRVKRSIQQIVNKGKFVDDLANKTGNKELTFKYDKMLSSLAEGNYAIGVAQTDNNGKIIGKSLLDIWKPIDSSGKEFDFSMYLLHKHNIDRYAQGKPVFGDDITGEISSEEVKKYERDNPEFIEWSKDIKTYNQNNLQNMVDAGLTSEESQKYYNDTYSNYVRIYREITGSTLITVQNGRLKVNSPIKTAKGGNQNILPLKESMAQQTIEIKNTIRRNDLGLELLNTLGNGQEVTEYGKDIVEKNEDGSYSFTVFKDGKPTKIEIDEGLYESIKPNKKYAWEDNVLLLPIQKMSKFQRSVLTVDNPLFIATNFFKDIGDAPFNSKYASKFAKNYVEAIKQFATKGELLQQYRALGGNQNTYFDYNEGIKPAPKGVMKFVEKIRTANEVIEQLPRLAEFISTLEAGGSTTEAMYNASEVTTNFKRGGEITKAINRNGANFLNASIQGFDKQIRNFSGQNGAKGYVNLLAKATVLGVLPSLLNHLLLDDDEDYEDLPEYIKDSYYLFKTGDNKFIRIPKGRVMSVFGSVARRTLEMSQGKEDAFKGFLNQTANQVAPNNPLDSNILSPIIQVATNKSWSGGEIVPKRLQDEEAKYQYDEKTDSISKFIGGIINVSPKKINYLLDQYTGGIGDVLLPPLTPQASVNPISAKFTTDSTLTNKNVSDFYDTQEKLTKKKNAPTATEEDILKSKFINSKQAQMNTLYAEKRKIQMSNLNNKEKTKQVKIIQAQINDIAENTLQSYEDYIIEKDYAQVGDLEFYKNSSNEWEKISEKQKTKQEEAMSTFDITAQEYYANREEYNYGLENPNKYKTIMQIADYSTYQTYKKEIDDLRENNDNRKMDTINYINSLKLSIPQKAMFIRQYYSSFDNYNEQIVNYIKKNVSSYEEREAILKELGFTIKEGRVYW